MIQQQRKNFFIYLCNVGAQHALAHARWSCVKHQVLFLGVESGVQQEHDPFLGRGRVVAGGRGHCGQVRHARKKDEQIASFGGRHRSIDALY